MSRQERERALIRWVHYARLTPLAEKRLIELGCGGGGSLFDFLRLGFKPENLVGNDLIEERLHSARRALPASVTLIPGNAASLELEDSSFDVVHQSVMCSSILDDRLLGEVCSRMWSLARPGGGVLWYDFVLDNPHNPDVRGIPFKKLLNLFPCPRARIKVWRITLAPPVSRAVTRIHPSMYTAFNKIPLLRTHILCWLPKGEPADTRSR